MAFGPVAVAQQHGGMWRQKSIIKLSSYWWGVETYGNMGSVNFIKENKVNHITYAKYSQSKQSPILLDSFTSETTGQMERQTSGFTDRQTHKR